MARLFTIFMLTLAMNFLAGVATVAWLYQSGHLDHEKVSAIREIVFPTTVPSTQPAQTEPVAATQPSALQELLAKHAALPPNEQVQMIRRTFDSQMAQLDRRQQELQSLQTKVDRAREQLQKEHDDLDKARTKVEDQSKAATKMATDKGFQESLELYTSMPAKTVKTIFMGLDDPTIIQYLQAMDSRAAAKIMKEFKLDPEIERLKRILEKMRQPDAVGKDPVKPALKE